MTGRSAAGKLRRIKLVTGGLLLLLCVALSSARALAEERFGTLPENVRGPARALLAGKPLSAEDRVCLQGYLSALSKGAPHPFISHLAPNWLFYEPAIKSQPATEFARVVFPRSIELVGHASIHASVRVGDRWIDIGHRPLPGGGYDRTQMICKVRRIDSAEKAAAMTRMYGRMGLSLAIPAPKETLVKLYRAYRRLPKLMPFDAAGQNGKENCLSMTTRVLAEQAPELGVPRICDEAEVHDFVVKETAKTRLLSVYSDDKISVLADPAARLQKMAEAVDGEGLPPQLQGMAAALLGN